MVNILQVEDEEALYAGIESMYAALCDDPAPNISEMMAPENWEVAAAEYTDNLSGALQPFHLVPEFIDSSLLQGKSDPTVASEIPKVILQTMAINLQPQQEDIKQIRFTHQADGGANFAATDRIDLLHEYKV